MLTVVAKVVRPSLRRFAAARSAVAATEFALIMPMLVLFMLGGGEAARFTNTSRRLTTVANSMATLIAERTTNMSANDAVFVFNSMLVTFPQILADAKAKNVAWYNDVAVTLSSIAFTATPSGCSTNCTYTAQVQWSANSPKAGTRSCKIPPQAASDTASPTLSTLPQDVFNAGTLIVVDVTFDYTPTFGGRFFKPVTIKRSAYLQPRYLSSISLSGVSC